jgi:hypothetical protein
MSFFALVLVSSQRKPIIYIQIKYNVPIYWIFKCHCCLAVDSSCATLKSQIDNNSLVGLYLFLLILLVRLFAWEFVGFFLFFCLLVCLFIYYYIFIFVFVLFCFCFVLLLSFLFFAFHFFLFLTFYLLTNKQPLLHILNLYVCFNEPNHNQLSEAVVVEDLRLPMQSVPITTDVVSSLLGICGSSDQ